MNALKTYGIQVALIVAAVLVAMYLANNVGAVKGIVGPKA